MIPARARAGQAAARAAIALAALVGSASVGCGSYAPPASDCDAYSDCPGEAGSDAQTTDVLAGDVIASDVLATDGDAASSGDGPGADSALGDGPLDTGVPCDSAAVIVCAGQCVDGTSPAHCGSCTNACPAPLSGNGTASCEAAPDGGLTCGVTCAMGYHGCGGDCLSDSDPASTAAGQDPCILNEAFGVFVSPTGSDATGTGSRAQPFATLGHAMGMAGTKRVYACATAGPYGENLNVSASHDGVNVYGGLDCTTTPGRWSYAASKLATVAPATGYALQVSGLTAGATFEDFSFVAPDTTGAGVSSVAVFVTGARNVAFHRVTMLAGHVLADGPTGGTGSNHYAGSLDGKSASGTTAGGSISCACGDGTTSTGGLGGSASQTSGAGLPALGGGAAGSNNLACSMAGASGGDGSDAPAGTADAPSSAYGTLMASGWAPANGVVGSSGKPGQGGGGGGDHVTTGAGGGGACGGCGGAGGIPGGGGGSSIALLSSGSAVSLVGCMLTAQTAGGGGQGGSGEAGQAGSVIAGNGASGGCPGGAGGSGAGGNGGQGGPGGLSLAIGYSGTAPSADGSTTTIAGTAGAGGPGGLAGLPAAGGTSPQPGVGGVKGPDGIAQATMAL